MTPAPLPSAEEWARIQDIFHQARSLDPVGRRQTLDRLCGGDPALREEVEALLDAEWEAAGLPVHIPSRAVPTLAGRRTGNYQLDELLGAGGMGSVYLAHRCDGQFHREVAVKVLGGNLRNEFFSERFATERRLLASLDHPNITRLIDAGVSDEGDPYLVLEYVKGRPIDGHCDRLSLPLRERIGLLLQVCDAVEYAHRRQVIHRDIKPSNVLVGEDGRAKLLDLGAAKLLAAGEADPTATCLRVMTPRYASPEQLRGEPVTGATDVYSLGVLLYELAVGAWPFGNPESIVAGLERAVREVAPRAPKEAITGEAAGRRGATQAALVRETGGELWKVVRKALQPHPEDRYSSARELAEDLNRFLSGRRVHAAPRGKRGTGAKLAAAAILIAIAALSFRGSPRYGAPGAGPEASLAVLPFRSLSNDPADRYLCDSLTDEITGAAGRIQPLRVIAQEQALRFRDQAAGVREIGRQLEATHVLEGNVERHGDRLKVVARLERTSDGAQVWSETLERSSAEAFAIPSALAPGIAAVLGGTIAPPSQHAPVPAARDEEQRGSYALDEHTVESLRSAEAHYRRAVELDPGYAAAYTGLGASILNRGAIEGRSLDQAIELAAGDFRKALELNPRAAQARVNLANVQLARHWDWAGAEAQYREALADNPNSGASTRYALLLEYEGRFAEADRLLSAPLPRDPITMRIAGMAFARELGRRYGEERRLYQSLADRFPGQADWRMFCSHVHTLENHPEITLKEIGAMKEANSSNGRLLRAVALAWAGRGPEAIAMADSFPQKDPACSQIHSEVYALLRDESHAVLWLDRLADERTEGVLNIGVNPAYDRIRGTAGFHRVLRRIGLER